MDDTIKQKIENRITELEDTKTVSTDNNQFDLGWNLLANLEIKFLRGLLDK